MASGTIEEARARRLVTLSVGFRLEGDGGLRLAGATTGLNENGLAGNVNVLGGSLPADPAGLAVEVHLDLPRDKPFRRIRGEIRNAGASWVPGFRHFLAIHFTDITDADIAFLRQFIAWREADHFRPDKPLRRWYVCTTAEHQVYGPLTADEVRRSVSVNGLKSTDLVWYPRENRWAPVTAPELDEECAWIGREVAGRDRPAAATGPERRQGESAPTGMAATRGGRRLSAPPTPAAIRTRRRRAAIRTAAILLLAASSLGAFWYGWLDFTPAGQLFRAARVDLGRGDRYEALRRFNEMRVSYPDNRLTRQGRVLMQALLEEDLAARDRQMARARLDLLDRLPESVRRLPQVLTARGDCLYLLGDLSGALALFRQAVEHSPEDGVFRYNLGTAALRSGDARTALEYLASAAPPLGESSDFCLNSGLAFLLNGREDDARARFEQAVRASTDRQGMVEITRAAIEDPANRLRLVSPPRVKPLRGLQVHDADESYRVLSFDLENPEPLTPAVARRHRDGPDLDLVPGEMLLLDEFDLDGATARELECPVGAWVGNPVNAMTRAVLAYDADQPFGARGQSLRLTYGLETLRFSAAGLWIRLRPPGADSLDLTRYRYLALTLRGVEGAPGFSSRAVIELRNRREMSQVELNGITNEWQEFKVPLSQFAGITDRSRMTELLLMVDQATATAFNGTLLIDDVKLIQ